MLQSMTGYGKAFGTFFNKKITVEMRALNSKGTDVYLKLPGTYKSYELPIRKMIGKALERGKVECLITEESIDGNAKVSINQELASAYYQQMKTLAVKVGEEPSDFVTAIMRMPDVLQTKESEVSEEEWQEVEKLIQEALKNITQFRQEEGKSLVADFTTSIGEIERLLQEVPKFEEVRIDVIRERMRKGLEKLQEKVDENRFEQELIYYIEKMDVSEEKTRLQHHLDYFRTTMENDGAMGKKLGFIGQEIGREINTLGSKAYHADLQKIVVEMKDNLEKIKEQVLNTL
ncbi:YicC family protein [Brumimicrobium salinarum]|uniref:YicC family protein n=1 Tax=Brumimicrobium salinarum TaxID=2058658 RepID=A0A2I0R4H7_9FLAO|nr:YicC/YloC family endoribonuclease [Brumimicrobium salinarum]PKR81494.1 YicC family protein [Brumimicrobium salinarum]